MDPHSNEKQDHTDIDAQYNRAYSEHPFDEPDEWGDLASFIDAAGQP